MYIIWITSVLHTFPCRVTWMPLRTSGTPEPAAFQLCMALHSISSLLKQLCTFSVFQSRSIIFNYDQFMFLRPCAAADLLPGFVANDMGQSNSMGPCAKQAHASQGYAISMLDRAKKEMMRLLAHVHTWWYHDGMCHACLISFQAARIQEEDSTSRVDLQLLQTSQSRRPSSRPS